jgi:hypothetical protein
VKEPKHASHNPSSIQAKPKEPASFAQQLAMEILTPTGHIFIIFGNTDPGLLRVSCLFQSRVSPESYVYRSLFIAPIDFEDANYENSPLPLRFPDYKPLCA